MSITYFYKFTSAAPGKEKNRRHISQFWTSLNSLFPLSPADKKMNFLVITQILSYLYSPPQKKNLSLYMNEAEQRILARFDSNLKDYLAH